MDTKKDIHFSKKKIDSDWKAEIERTKETSSNPKASEVVTSPLFLNFIQSLGIQALMHLGDIPNPVTHQKEIHLEAAKEVIDILLELKQKTKGNTSPQENEMLESLVTQLQIKFSENV